MKITKSELLKQPKQFWINLLFCLWATSPYFGKLKWAFGPGFYYSRNEIDTARFRSALNELPDHANLEQICRKLMTTIFCLPPDYVRPPLIFDRDINEITEGMESNYPHYHILESLENYRPIQEAEIQPPDIKMFQQKLSVLGGPDPWKDYFSLSRKANSVHQKLTQWIQLIQQRNE